MYTPRFTGLWYAPSQSKPFRLGFGVEVEMSVDDNSISRAEGSPTDTADPREDLVQRVVSSSTFEKSPKLRAFLRYVCRCALENEPAAATEQQIGIHVFGRSPGYNPNEDNIVRSQARLLRLKLEHHFAHEGKDEQTVITIPKGRYVPAFEKRVEIPAQQKSETTIQPRVETRRGRPLALITVILILGFTFVWLVSTSIRRKNATATPAASGPAGPDQVATPALNIPGEPALSLPAGEIRIAAGSQRSPFVDARGRSWGTDQLYQGGVAKAGSLDLFPPVADAVVFKTMREGASADSMAPPAQSEFRYSIPVPPGVYELRLYFADPLRRANPESLQDAQNARHFNVNVNGRPILSGFDVISDAGTAPIDVRAFKDIGPASDGKVHLEFIPSPERPFVNAVELVPGTPGKLNPIRISARNAELVDNDGTRWIADNYYIGGRTSTYSNPDAGPQVAPLYTNERYGNFSYAIPVPPGSYTIRLHFLESFFSPLTAPSGICRGAGCRVFEVTCNGVELLRDFDVYQAAGGAFRPVVRTFHNLHPNGQGKLLLSFSPRVNYAEVRAIEVVDEAK